MDTLRFKGARQAARIDHQVGERIRRRRTFLGYTQEQLAESLDISYQQVQKYETGANRVSAGRLFQIAQRLEVPIAFFFEGLGVEFDDAEAASNRSVIDLVRSFNQISDSSVRNALAHLVKSLANQPEPSEGRLARPAANGATPNGAQNGASNGEGGSDSHD